MSDQRCGADGFRAGLGSAEPPVAAGAGVPAAGVAVGGLPAFSSLISIGLGLFSSSAVDTVATKPSRPPRIRVTPAVLSHADLFLQGSVSWPGPPIVSQSADVFARAEIAMPARIAPPSPSSA